MVTEDFWRGRRVFLTGHTGFKGAWLSLWLQSMGADVTGFALAPPTSPSLFELARVASGMRSLTGDVRDPQAVTGAMRAAAPDVVIHMAAQSLVRPSYADPVETYATNVMGTVHVLDATRHVPGVRAAVIVTSDKCYENREWVWGYRETEAMGGFDPYSSSKGCAEIVTAAYRASYFDGGRGPAVASARAGNVIGGGDWAVDRLVPDAMRAFERDERLVVRNPAAVRPWQHVLEPLSGYLLLAEALAEGKPVATGWNFGADDGQSRPVSWVADRLVALWGGRAAWAHDARHQPHEAMTLRLDSSKARHELGWRPALSLDTALEWTVAWYRAPRRGEDLRDLSLAQIARYRDVCQA